MATTAQTTTPLDVEYLTAETIRPLLPGGPDFEAYARGIMYVVLDIPGRRLYPYVPQTRDDHGPGRYVSFGEEDYLFVPPVVKFVLNVDYHPALAGDLAALNAFMDEIAPDCAEMIDTMAEGPGGALDWSVRSRSIAEELKHRVDRLPYRGTQYDHPHDPSPLTTAEELFAEFPQLVSSKWVDMDSEELDSAASRVLLESLRLGSAKGDYNRRPRAVGIRSWMYAYRDRAGTLDRQAVDAAAWPGMVARRAVVRDDSTDAELDLVAQAAIAAAEAEGVRLIGAAKLVKNLRDQRRADVRAQLKAEGDHIAALEDQLKPAKVRRRAMVARVLSWNVSSDSDTTIARDAAMSHTAVAAIRASLNTDDDQ